MKGSYSVYVILPKTIKLPAHLETNLAPPHPPRKISITLTRNSSLRDYATSMCNPMKKPQGHEKMST